ncbi:hypothetical protein [Dyella sp. KRB-257]|uniref:hypothetical protein n=1 Tax=Dyella sp. KRB-257 TaxID=3400915 RepID=UPI003C2D6B95
MKQFIPFEDDWALAEALACHRLVPYQPGMRCIHEISAALRPGPAGPARQNGRHEERNSSASTSQPATAAL